jgi:endonuclease-3
MKKPSETRAIVAKLRAQHPDADTALHFADPFQLLVATVLSAQTTDERVNQVTPDLFARFPDAHALAAAQLPDVEELIHATGFYSQKSRSLVGMARTLVERHGGSVPPTMDDLVELPGVGRKTANVVLGHALGVPGLAVDRHVLRVANRIGIAGSQDPDKVEQQLTSALPRDTWTVTSDTLILHGRRICKPHPLCDRCAVRDECDFYRSGSVAGLAGPAGTTPRRKAAGSGRGPVREKGGRHRRSAGGTNGKSGRRAAKRGRGSIPGRPKRRRR